LNKPATAVALGVVATVSDEELWRHLDIIASVHFARAFQHDLTVVREARTGEVVRNPGDGHIADVELRSPTRAASASNGVPEHARCCCRFTMRYHSEDEATWRTPAASMTFTVLKSAVDQWFPNRSDGSAPPWPSTRFFRWDPCCSS
jgi:hypothetical protein